MITGGILAGGRGRRMDGADKGLLPFAGEPLIAHVLRRLAPQVGPLLINANRNLEAYAQLGYPVVADRRTGFPGPLAGIAALLAATPSELLLVVPCDAPLLPDDLAQRLHAALSQCPGATVCAAHDGARLQPTFLLLHRTLLPGLEQALVADQRRLQEWLRGERLAIADYADNPTAFANLNTPQELAAAQPLLARCGPVGFTPPR